MPNVGDKWLKRASKEAKARAEVLRRGGTFVKINWNKGTVHYITKSGKKTTL